MDEVHVLVGSWNGCIETVYVYEDRGEAETAVVNLKGTWGIVPEHEEESPHSVQLFPACSVVLKEKHQCRTCRWGELTYASSPSGPEDGVDCHSLPHLQKMVSDTHGDTADVLVEYEEVGYANLWTLENMADEWYRCPFWASRKEDIREQRLPAPDEAPVTYCPWCGKEYQVSEPEPDADYVMLAEETKGGPRVYRHQCGHLVKFVVPEE